MREFCGRFPFRGVASYESWFWPVAEDTPMFYFREEAWVELLRLVRDQSSPGAPFMYIERLNGALKEYHSLELKCQVEKRLRALHELGRSRDVTAIPGDFVDPKEAVRLVDSGCADPVRLVNKNEPQKNTKPTRNVSSVGVVDSMVDAFLYWMQCLEEINAVQDAYKANQHWRHPSTVGIDLQTPWKLHHLFKRFKLRVLNAAKKGYRIVSNDISGYEYSESLACQQFYHLWWIAQSLRGGLGGAPVWWQRLHAGRSWCIAHVLLVSSGGQMYTLSIAIKTSGQRRTAHGNSVVRAVLPTVANTAAALPLGGAVLESDVNGDDCAEEDGGKTPDVMERAYAALGFKMTDILVQDPGAPLHVVFCSWNFEEGNSRPEGYGKALMKLCQNRVVIPFAEYLQFHTRYVSTRVLQFAEVFPLISSMVPVNTRDALLAQGLISQGDYDATRVFQETHWFDAKGHPWVPGSDPVGVEENGEQHAKDESTKGQTGSQEGC